MKPRQLVESASSGPEHLAPVESNVFSRLSQLVAHCAVVRFEDGSPRQPGWITFRTLGGSWQVTAKEPGANAQLVAVGPTLDDALAALDLLLASPDAPWELDPWAKRQDQKKKK